MASYYSHPADVYAEELFKRKFGWPLWRPELREIQGKLTEVQIGDIGLMVEGSFISVFNVITPEPDHAPPDLVPLSIPPCGLFSDDYYIPPGIIASSSMTAVSLEGGLEVHSAGASFDLQCSDDRAAFLVLSDHAKGEKLVGFDGQIMRYIAKHYKSWLQYQKSLGLDEDESQLAFIAGWAKTSQWALGSVQQKEKTARLQFKADFSTATAQLILSGESKHRAALDQRTGPPLAHRFMRKAAKDCKEDESYSMPPNTRRLSKTKKGKHKHGLVSEPVDQILDRVLKSSEEPHKESDLPKNQCIFINYFKWKRRLKIFPHVIKAAAEPHDLLRHQDDESASALQTWSHAQSDNDVIVERVPVVKPACDPVGFILDYILQNSEAEVAIACDWQLIRVCGDAVPDDIPGYLQAVQPSIKVTEEGAGVLFLDDSNPYATHFCKSEEAIAAPPTEEPEVEMAIIGRINNLLSNNDPVNEYWQSLFSKCYIM